MIECPCCYAKALEKLRVQVWSSVIARSDCSGLQNVCEKTKTKCCCKAVQYSVCYLLSGAGSLFYALSFPVSSSQHSGSNSFSRTLLHHCLRGYLQDLSSPDDGEVPRCAREGLSAWLVGGTNVVTVCWNAQSSPFQRRSSCPFGVFASGTCCGRNSGALFSFCSGFGGIAVMALGESGV